MSNKPFVMIDHASLKTMSLRRVVDGEEQIMVVFRERLNWIGYQAIMDYIQAIINSSRK